jgi:catechol 2,3-dioxygenase-like lactoylglutathione lyase family enzyme
MKRLHVHIAVDDLAQSIRFYNALFAQQPSVQKPDYAKWALEDPRVNFAISKRGRKAGLDHLGIQAENDAELAEVHARLKDAALPIASQQGAACCYAKSNKHWTVDPQGIAWESFHTLDRVPVYGEDRGSDNAANDASACCTPKRAQG